MEPLIAVSLAANVAQFVELAWKIVTGANDIATSTTGRLAHHDHYDIIAQSIASLHENIVILSTASLEAGKLSRHDQRLLPLREACVSVGNELIGHLDRLRVEGKVRKWKSVRVALLSVVKEGKIKELEERLAKLQNQVDSVLIADLGKQQSAVFCLLNTHVQASNQRLQVSKDLLSVTSSIERSFERLHYRLDAIEGTQQPPAFKKHRVRLAPEERRLRDEERGKMKELNSSEKRSELCQLAPLAERGQILALQQAFLLSLDYDMRLSREQTIKEAHANTFKWIFDEPKDTELAAIPFLHWLEEEGGVFWITGKPGSGKSTLMRYLWAEQMTHLALEKWAKNGRLATARFYFWNSGTAMQRSLEGLLRSLLVQILDQCPELIPKLFPDRWNTLQISRNHMLWSTNELLEGIRALTAEASLSSRFCFFIDGLDEYDGTDKEIVGVIESFSASPFFKLCLSSRPHPQFIKAYGNDTLRSLSVSSLTTGDIRLFVHDTLAKNEMFQTLIQEYGARCQKLVDDIVNEANGVFLWVYLVVARLLEGIEVNNDRMSDLERKLQCIPKELDQLFRLILDSVESDYHEPQAHMFRAACAAANYEPLDLMAYYFMDIEDTDYALHLPTQPMKTSDIEEKQKIMAVRINVRCKGLLEVVGTAESDPGVPMLRMLKVQPIHRTFRDFLSDKKMHELIYERSAPDFDLYRSICLAMLAELKVCELVPSRHCHQYHILENILYYASESENKQSASPNDILDGVARMFPTLSEALSEQHKPNLLRTEDRFTRWEEYSYLLSQKPSADMDVPFAFIQLAAAAGSTEYSKQKIEAGNLSQAHLNYLLSQSVPIKSLYHHFQPMMHSERVFPYFETAIIEMLLDAGADPDSAWTAFPKDGTAARRLVRYEIGANIRAMKMLIEYGGSIEKCIEVIMNMELYYLYMDELSDIEPYIPNDVLEARLTTIPSATDLESKLKPSTSESRSNRSSKPDVTAKIARRKRLSTALKKLLR
ncbi:hypothetical protein CC80DRAFT_537934 [Byssothecium circinans]|uniref:Uncharacterized protein n=1 Tax=Byssothecium circinans TaxID=147558 RepID=A0A6A5TMD9_9PLEO|nr:hypothetical protein CC80DRAFT_537934 [Byssothecium circinans]